VYDHERVDQFERPRALLQPPGPIELIAAELCDARA
jgi:hypothetical protein